MQGSVEVATRSLSSATSQPLLVRRSSKANTSSYGNTDKLSANSEPLLIHKRIRAPTSSSQGMSANLFADSQSYLTRKQSEPATSSQAEVIPASSQCQETDSNEQLPEIQQALSQISSSRCNVNTSMGSYNSYYKKLDIQIYLANHVIRCINQHEHVFQMMSGNL